MLSLLWCTPASALNTEGTIRDLRHTAWGPAQGVPGPVTALAQSSDGYLWIGTAGGLFRFDGLQFEHVELPRNDRISSSNIFELFAPASGGLWIGFTLGGVGFLKDGELTAYGERDGLPPGSVKAFAQDQKGTLWVGSTSGLARLKGSRWEIIGPELGYSETKVVALMADGGDTVWAASERKVFFLNRDNDGFRNLSIPLSAKDEIVGFAKSPEGIVWLRTNDGLRKIFFSGKSVLQFPTAGQGLIFDRDGILWSKSDKVDRLINTASFELNSFVPNDAIKDRFTASDGLSGEGGVRRLLADREGNIWTMSEIGIDRFSDRNISPFKIEVIQKTLTLWRSALAPGDKGSLWIGDYKEPPFRLENRESIRVNKIDGISCVIRLEDGSIWFGSRTGVWKYSANKFVRNSLPNDSDNFDVQAMAQDRSGRLWVSIVRKGVSQLADGVWTAYGGITSLPKLTAITLSTDAKGRIWFGYTEGRMAVLDGDKVTVFSDQSRLAVGNVTAIYGKRTRVWAGGELGLAMFDGEHFKALTPDTPSAFKNVTGIVETADGDLWLSSAAGVVHVTAVESRRAADDSKYRVQTEIFDARDGVLGSSARIRPLPTAVEGTDGRLWFLTSVGLYSIDPSRIVRNKLPPPVLIQSLTVDDRVYHPAAGLTLPQRSASVRIDYVAPSLTMAEKVRYRYRLDGVDKGWQDVQGRRQAFYNNLSPGPHRFQVIAANNDGVWNEEGATLNFVIQPAFVQTGWFVALCIAGGGMAVLMLIRVRDRQLAARIRGRAEERMAERERIARELHDTLLQSTQGLILKVHSASKHVPSGSESREMLEMAMEQAEQVMIDGRQRIQELRVPTSPRGDLPSSIAKMGVGLARGQAVEFKSIVEGSTRDLHPRACDEALRICGEAMTNAFRHAHARSIEVQTIYTDASLRLRIRDDGVGIDPATVEAASRPGHWGLQGMRERARDIGAQLELWSRLGAGTEIELTIPAEVAYVELSPRRRWFGRWWRVTRPPRRAVRTP